MLDWDNEEDRERIMQMEALRDMHNTNTIANSDKNKVKSFNVEQIKPDETMKSFNKRVREETKRVSFLYIFHFFSFFTYISLFFLSRS